MTLVPRCRQLTRVHSDDIVRSVGSRPYAIFCETKSAEEWRCEGVEDICIGRAAKMTRSQPSDSPR